MFIFYYINKKKLNKSTGMWNLGNIVILSWFSNMLHLYDEILSHYHKNVWSNTFRCSFRNSYICPENDLTWLPILELFTSYFSSCFSLNDFYNVLWYTFVKKWSLISFSNSRWIILNNYRLLNENCKKN